MDVSESEGVKEEERQRVVCKKLNKKKKKKRRKIKADELVPFIFQERPSQISLKKFRYFVFFLGPSFPPSLRLSNV